MTAATPRRVGCRPTRTGDPAPGRLAWVLAVTVAFLVVEAVGGVLARSLALLADAGHMLTDAAAIGLALVVAVIARRPATARKTFGYVRWEILAALINGAALLAIAGGIVWEAVRRLGEPPDVRPGLMLGVAIAGLAANLLAMRLLHRHHHASLNVRGAYLHVLSDLLGSVGAIVAGVVVATTGWNAADPLVSIFIAVLVLRSAWRLVRESVDVLLEGTPTHIALAEVEERLVDIPGVHDVHDLHVWTVTSGLVAMSGHMVVDDPARHQTVLETAHRRLRSIGIHHVTMQIERERLCPTFAAAL